MTTPVSELEQMLHDAERLGDGPARFAALDTVFRHADAAGETAFAYRARMNTLEQMHDAGEYARAFMTFSWCLTTFDKHPEVTRPDDEQSLLWAYKWIVWELSQFPGVTLDRAAGVLDDMERRYRAGGHSPHAVHQHRLMMATHLGDFAEAARQYDELVTAKRDGLSDCRACVPTTQAQYLAAAGRYEDAVAVGAPFVNGGCSEQPHQILTQLLLPYLHTGRHSEAVEAHRKAYARVRGHRDDLELIALHVEFCALTGNDDHGLAIVEQHLPWLDRPASPCSAMDFAAAAALLMKRLIEAGRGGEILRRRSDTGDRRWDSTVAETFTELAGLARAEAARFDARNHNTYQSGRVEARLAAEPILAELPLTVLAGRRIADDPAAGEIAGLVRQVTASTVAGDAAGAARTRLELAYLLRNAGKWGDATETAEEARRSLDRAGLRDEASAARHLLVELYRRDWQQRETAYALLAELLAEPALPPGLPDRAALLSEAAGLSQGDVAAGHLRAAAELHRAAGKRGKEARALLEVLRQSSSRPADWAGLVARIDELSSTFRGRKITEVQAVLCHTERGAGELERALERARRHPALGVDAADLLLSLGRAVEAEEAVRAVLEAEGRNWRAARVLARSLLAQDRRDEAQTVLHEHGLGSIDELEDYPGDSD